MKRSKKLRFAAILSAMACLMASVGMTASAESTSMTKGDMNAQFYWVNNRIVSTLAHNTVQYTLTASHSGSYTNINGQVKSFGQSTTKYGYYVSNVEIKGVNIARAIGTATFSGGSWDSRDKLSLKGN